MSDWTKLSDEQPESGADVLIWSKKMADFDKSNKCKLRGVRVGKYTEGIGLVPHGTMGYDGTHWMRVPEPPL